MPNVSKQADDTRIWAVSVFCQTLVMPGDPSRLTRTSENVFPSPARATVTPRGAFPDPSRAQTRTKLTTK